MEQVTAPRPAPSLAPEHDWAAASKLIHPTLKPIGTAGVDSPKLHPEGASSSWLPLIRPGPAGLPIAYVIPGTGFDVLVGSEHLLSWGVGSEEVHTAAMANLAAWSAKADWVEETEGQRRIIWSDLGEGMDAARILLDEVRAKLAKDLGPGGRILVGLPERDLLIATAVAADDHEFAGMFADHVADRAQAADEPIDGRVFELVKGELVEFEAPKPA
jgi:hypothetical protein